MDACKRRSAEYMASAATNDAVKDLHIKVVT